MTETGSATTRRGQDGQGQGEDIVPIPGTKSPQRLEENAAAAELRLSQHDVEELEDSISRDAVRGEHYPDAMMALLNN